MSEWWEQGAGAQAGLLLLDTCGREASVALAAGDHVVAQITLDGRSASEQLVGSSSALLEGAGWRLADLAALAVVRGPGSFTGVRVGLSVAKALGEAVPLPLIGLSRLEVLAAAAGVTSGAVVAALDAGRGECFWALLENSSVTDEGVATAERVTQRTAEARARLVIEEADATRFAGYELITVPALTAATGLATARLRFRARTFDDPMLLDALYLHRTEEQMLERQRAHRAAARPSEAEAL